MTPMEEMKTLVIEAIKMLPSGTSTYLSIAEALGDPKGEDGTLIVEAIAELEKEGVIEAVYGILYHWRVK